MTEYAFIGFSVIGLLMYAYVIIDKILDQFLLIEERKNATRKETAYIMVNALLDVSSSIVNTFGKDYIIATKTMNTSLSDHMNALNQLISTEFYNAILLPRLGKKDKPPIDDIKATTDMIANRIMDALQPEFFNIFKYHGISEEFIMSYITRELFAKLIEFTRTNRKKEI